MVEQWSIISLGWVLLAIRRFGDLAFISVINIFNITIYGIAHIKVYTHIHGTCISLLVNSQCSCMAWE